MFVGRFEHSLDGKGRLVLPSAFREELAGGAVLAPWDRCLALWTAAEFHAVASNIKERIAEGRGDSDVMRLFFAAAYNVKPDSQGRFVVPEEHRTHAALGRDVVVAGQFDRVELWDRERFVDVENRKGTELTDVIRGLRL